jgi:hypothetical protein
MKRQYTSDKVKPRGDARVSFHEGVENVWICMSLLTTSRDNLTSLLKIKFETAIQFGN